MPFEALVPVDPQEWVDAMYLNKIGTMCKEHKWLLDVYQRSRDATTRPAKECLVDRFGILGVNAGLDTANYDYAVYRALGLTIENADQAHLNNNIYLVLHAKPGAIWSLNTEGWSTAIVVRKEEKKWHIIPIA